MLSTSSLTAPPPALDETVPVTVSAAPVKFTEFLNALAPFGAVPAQTTYST